MYKTILRILCVPQSSFWLYFGYIEIECPLKQCQQTWEYLHSSFYRVCYTWNIFYQDRAWKGLGWWHVRFHIVSFRVCFVKSSCMKKLIYKAPWQCIVISLNLHTVDITYQSRLYLLICLTKAYIWLGGP